MPDDNLDNHAHKLSASSSTPGDEPTPMPHAPGKLRNPTPQAIITYAHLCPTPPPPPISLQSSVKPRKFRPEAKFPKMRGSASTTLVQTTTYTQKSTDKGARQDDLLQMDPNCCVQLVTWTLQKHGQVSQGEQIIQPLVSANLSVISTG